MILATNRYHEEDANGALKHLEQRNAAQLQHLRQLNAAQKKHVSSVGFYVIQ